MLKETSNDFDTGGDKPLLPVDDVRKIMKMILSGVSHIHANRIVHRDLKPGNIVFYNQNGKLNLKIIDFGCALELNKVKSSESGILIGTPAFMAPEIFQEKGSIDCYKEAVDVWACGIIMYSMLTAEVPFYSQDSVEMIQMIKTDVVNLEGRRTLSNVPDSAKSLLRLMLNRNVRERIKAADCL